jgi:hypothetical protein
MKFYFNNKLHKHLRSDQHSRNHQKNEAIEHEMIANILIVISTREHKDHKEFVFKKHQYVRVKEAFESRNNSHELCVDFETFMSLIDRRFFKQNISNVDVMKTEFNLKIRKIEFKTHDTSEYCRLYLYFQEQADEQSKITHIIEKFHLINDLQTNVLIDMNIMSSEKCILNFRIKNMIFSTCENIAILIIIVRTNEFVNRFVLTATKIIVSSHTDMIVLIKIRKKSLSNKDYVFNSKRETSLDFEEEFFSHILINKSVKVHVRNISDQTYVILKNYKIERMNDFHEIESFAIFSENKHLTIAFNKLSKQRTNSRNIQNSETSQTNSVEIVLLNEITVHENKKTISCIANVVDNYLNVWKDISKTINISQKKWMKIKTILETNSETCRIYKLRIENQEIIN